MLRKQFLKQIQRLNAYSFQMTFPIISANRHPLLQAATEAGMTEGEYLNHLINDALCVRTARLNKNQTKKEKKPDVTEQK